MDDFVRVKLTNGAEATVTKALADEHKLEVLDKPAVNARGEALNDKPHVALTPSNPDAAPYLGMSVDELRDAATARELTVEGSGKDGNVIKADYVAALVAHDATTAASSGAS